ncbi:guanosine-3',5'-bis(diphosphate) 3'-pyrophosphohydrolase [Escherichia coli]|uniref:Guanosine-3',5'-bis(Diphosphate) 3'-pyrophosphohydrolase n=1 Tax=Escherichia coli TaxID=562 RepID=A0A3S5DUL3_ECOLX|nr:guanosine-3',5'-bis(diphosphate) 3'-pyrophosphohydrolase [Escherichia coli]
MAVEWDKETAQEFITEIKVEMFNHQGALANLTAAINTTTSNIQSLNTEEKDGRVYSAFIRLTARDRVHLANIMRKIRVMPDVIKVTRTELMFMNPTRYARICEMLARRQPDLTVCMEQVHKPHNVSAIIVPQMPLVYMKFMLSGLVAGCAPWLRQLRVVTAGYR